MDVLQSLFQGLDLASRYVLLGCLYYVFIAYPALKYLQWRRRQP